MTCVNNLISTESGLKGHGETFKPPHYARQFKSPKLIWHTCLLSGIVANEMLTNYSERTYGKINDCIITLTHLTFGWKYVVHSRLTKLCFNTSNS